MRTETGTPKGGSRCLTAFQVTGPARYSPARCGAVRCGALRLFGRAHVGCGFRSGSGADEFCNELGFKFKRRVGGEKGLGDTRGFVKW